MIKNTLYQTWKQKEGEWGRDITITEIAAYTGYSRDTIRRLKEGDVKTFNLEVADGICEYLGLPDGPLSFLVYERDKTPAHLKATD